MEESAVSCPFTRCSVSLSLVLFFFPSFTPPSSFPWRSHSNNGGLGCHCCRLVSLVLVLSFAFALFFSSCALHLQHRVSLVPFQSLGDHSPGSLGDFSPGRKILTIFSIIDSSSLPGFVQVGSLFAPTTQFSSVTIGFSTKPETGSAIFPVRNETWKTVSVLSPRLLINNTTVEPQPRL